MPPPVLLLLLLEDAPAPHHRASLAAKAQDVEPGAKARPRTRSRILPTPMNFAGLFSLMCGLLGVLVLGLGGKKAAW